MQKTIRIFKNKIEYFTCFLINDLIRKSKVKILLIDVTVMITFPNTISDDPDSTFKSTRHVSSDTGDHYGFNHFGTFSGSGFLNGVTPVSTITVFGLIGDFCISDADCQVPNSACSLRSRRFVCCFVKGHNHE